MILLLDTSVIIDLENKNKATIEKLAKLKKSYPEVPKISFITYFEFIYGIRKKQPHNKEKLVVFIELFDVVQTTKATANILSMLKEKYGDIPFPDLFIASQAIENNMVLLTKDRDFDRIESLTKIIM